MDGAHCQHVPALSRSLVDSSPNRCSLRDCTCCSWYESAYRSRMCRAAPTLDVWSALHGCMPHRRSSWPAGKWPPCRGRRGAPAQTAAALRVGSMGAMQRLSSRWWLASKGLCALHSLLLSFCVRCTRDAYTLHALLLRCTRQAPRLGFRVQGWSGSPARPSLRGNKERPTARPTS